MIDWAEIDPANPPRGESLLWYPATSLGAYREHVMTAMVRVGHWQDSPRKATHWAPLNNPDGSPYPARAQESRAFARKRKAAP